jgi:hypothetical protein
MKKFNEIKNSLKTIRPGNLPTRLPFISTAVILLILDRFQAPAWTWGIICTLLGIYWILACLMIYQEERVDIFEELDEKDDKNGQD